MLSQLQMTKTGKWLKGRFYDLIVSKVQSWMAESRGVQQLNDMRDPVPLGAVPCVPAMAKHLPAVQASGPGASTLDREEGETAP